MLVERTIATPCGHPESRERLSNRCCPSRGRRARKRPKRVLAGSLRAQRQIPFGVCALKKVPVVSDPSTPPSGNERDERVVWNYVIFSLAKVFLTRNVPKLDARGKICLG